MGILKSAADLVYTIRFLKLLTTPIKETETYKAGIIDEKGKRRKDFDMGNMENREKYRDHYTPFHRLVFNIKKIMSKAPGLGSKLGSYAAALYLIKEHGNLDDKGIDKIHKDTGIDILDILQEQSEWFVIENYQLSPGVYRIKNDSVTSNYIEPVSSNDQLRITEEKSYPCGEILGIRIYEAIHMKSQQPMYVTTGELTK